MEVLMHFYELTREEIQELDRPARGQGGFQTFMKRLQSQLNHATSTIHLTDGDIADIQHHAFDYEQGGFQDRLGAIFGRSLGLSLGRDK